MIDRIYELNSAIPLSPYAPEYKFYLSRSIWNDKKQIDTIRKFCLEKEKEILELPYFHDADTGLNENHVTTRFARYNLFDFINECPELQNLWDEIYNHWLQKIKIEKTPDYKSRIVCWFNVLRKGEFLAEHRHSSQPTAYLSGNIHLDNYHTNTTYKHLDHWVSIDNVKGGCVMFPSQLAHFTDKYENDGERVSIAFDLYVTDLNDLDDESPQKATSKSFHT